jgi:hypothetical protein
MWQQHEHARRCGELAVVEVHAELAVQDVDELVRDMVSVAGDVAGDDDFQ